MARSSATQPPLKRILIIGASWVGDAVLSQPLLKYLKTTQECTIDVLAPPWTQGVLERMPEVNRILTSPLVHKRLNLKGLWQCAQEIKRTGYDTAYLLPNSFKSALIPWLAGIPNRIGYTREGRSILLSQKITLDTVRHPLMVQRFLALANGSHEFNDTHYPQLSVDSIQQQALLKTWQLNQQQPIAVLCPGAEYGPAKRWPDTYYQQVAKTLLAQGMQVWLMGSKKDKAIADVIRTSLEGRIINLCGETTLAQAVDLMALASFIVTNDSGLMHVGAALQRPLIAIFGSSSPQFTPPLDKKARILSSELPCSPCFQRECPLGHTNCLKEITPEQVLQAIKELPLQNVANH